MSDVSSSIDQRITSAAQALVAEHGEGFTLEQLEARACVSRATIYRRVGSKAALLKRLADARGDTYERGDMRRSILEAARVVFGRAGFAAATVEQIAAEAGVGVATVYRHFGDKERLIHAFVDDLTPRSAVRALPLHATADVAADLHDVVAALLQFFYANRDLFRLMLLGAETERRYLERLRGPSDSTLMHLTRYFEIQLDAGHLRPIGEARQLALALLGLVLSFAVIGPMHYGTPLDEPTPTSAFIVQLFLHEPDRRT